MVGQGVFVDSFLICATPRTGSSLLCGMLGSTKVAGMPESYFRAADETAWASTWGISGADGTFDDADYLAAALAAGRTDNGVFAARVMWGTLEELTATLRTIHCTPEASDLDVLIRAFGRTRFVHVRRLDIVAQAVSWLKAEQTDVWVAMSDAAIVTHPRRAHFDQGALDTLCRTITEHDLAWQQWFAAAGTEPYVVTYEQLDRDPMGVARGVLDFLGLDSHDTAIRVRHRRLADETTGEWIARYRATRSDAHGHR